MKLKTKIIAGTATLAFVAFAAGSLQAANQVTNLLTITATIQEQGSTNINVHSGVTTVTAPTKFAFNTKQFLALLAQDEHAASNYNSTTFPPGAKLVIVVSDSNAPYFCQVVDKNNNFLVDVSNILKFQTNIIFQLYSGKTKNYSFGVGGDPTVTTLHVPTFGFDDSGITNGVGFQCSMVGLMKTTVTYTIVNRSTLVVTTSGRIASFAGAGTNQGTPFLVTGSLNATGRRTFR